jgi:hypothetical protein
VHACNAHGLTGVRLAESVPEDACQLDQKSPDPALNMKLTWFEKVAWAVIILCNLAAIGLVIVELTVLRPR